MNYVTEAKVIQIIEHDKMTREYIMTLSKERKYNPGSFVQLSLELVTASDIWPDSRTFSIASYEKGIMRFIIKNVGYYTARIFDELEVGSACTVKYPFGNLYSKKRDDEKHLFIAGGVGITPYLSLVRYFETKGLQGNVSLLYSAKHYNDLLHFDYLKATLRGNLELFITREKTTAGHERRITVDDVKRVADLDCNVYICGSKSFNSDFHKQLKEIGYKKLYMDEWE